MAIRTRKLAKGKVSYEITVKHDGKREYATAHTLADAHALEIALKSRYGQYNACAYAVVRVRVSQWIRAKPAFQAQENQ